METEPCASIQENTLGTFAKARDPFQPNVPFNKAVMEVGIIKAFKLAKQAHCLDIAHSFLSSLRENLQRHELPNSHGSALYPTQTLPHKASLPFRYHLTHFCAVNIPCDVLHCNPSFTGAVQLYHLKGTKWPAVE
jgi:hypothetical protein